MNNRSPRITLLGIAFLACWFSTDLARAEPKAHKPDWLREGMVLTYTWHAAVAPGIPPNYTQNVLGEFIDRNTGKVFNASKLRGTSGSGWTQLTVSCLDGDKAIVAKSSFADAGALGNNEPVPQQGGGSFSLPVDAAGDYWMDPARLRTLQTDADRGVLVTSLAWNVNGRAIDAVRVEKLSSTYSNNVYDARTGICMHFAATARSAPASKLTGVGETGSGNTTLTSGDFVGPRNLAIPWADEPIPDWVRGMKALRYRGSITAHGTLPTVPNDLTVEIKSIASGNGWLQVATSTTAHTQGVPPSAPVAGEAFFGRNQFGGLWAGPKALNAMQRGQVLDQDPVTKMRTVVSAMDTNSITITSSNAAGEIQSEYDRTTGRLVATSFYDVLSKQKTAVRLQNVE